MAKEAETVHLEAPLEVALPPKKKRTFVNVPAAIPVDSEARAKWVAASEALVKKRQAERAAQGAVARFDEKALVAYIECTDSECLGPGIWIIGDPQEELTDSKWEASYHPKGSSWPVQVTPWCQCCFARCGAKRPLRIWSITTPRDEEGRATTVGLVANPRFVRTIARSEYEELISEGKE